MPINAFGAEVINGFVILDSQWNTAKTTRTIIGLRLDGEEYVTAVAGKVGVTEWHAGHYFHTNHTRNAFERALADYRSR